MEASLELARQYFVEKGEPQRTQVVGRRQSYHGNTPGALAVGGNQWRRRQFEPLLIGASHVSPCYHYRGENPGESDAARKPSPARRSAPCLQSPATSGGCGSSATATASCSSSTR